MTTWKHFDLRKPLLPILFMLMILSGLAQGPELQINQHVNDEDGILIDKNTVQTFLIIENKGEGKVDMAIHWTIMTDDWRPLKSMTVHRSVEPNQSIRADCPLYRFPGAGFYRVKAQVNVGDSWQQDMEHVIGVDPEEITAPKDEIQDFEQFWDKALNELAAVAPDYKLTPVERPGAKTDLYRVEMKSYQGKTVRGWLEVPKSEGVYPALLRVPGYQENMEPIDVMDDMIVFSFNTRDHGESDDSNGEGTRAWDMWVRGFEAVDNYYYKGLFLDCIRAMDFLESREDVDQNRIAIWGGSQGGGLSFSTAALDQRVDLCIADIPYMSEYPRYFEITYWPEVDSWFAENPTSSWDQVLNTLSYYDTKNFADKIECPVWMGIGLQDDICPPATSFVAYNKVQTEKSYVVYKNEKHSQPREHYTNRFKELRTFFEMDK